MSAALRILLPEDMRIPFAKYTEQLEDCKPAVVYAIAKGQCTASAEPNHLASMRLCFKGTRLVVLIATAVAMAIAMERAMAIAMDLALAMSMTMALFS